MSPTIPASEYRVWADPIHPRYVASHGIVSFQLFTVVQLGNPYRDGSWWRLDNFGEPVARVADQTASELDRALKAYQQERSA